jgi:tryptophan 2,3-dioxygenase
LINDWLERMPFVSSSSFWSDYENVYAQNLDTSEKQNLEFFQKIFSETEMSNRSLSPTACRSALFIMLYRGYPLLELPFKLMDTLIELDHQLGNWRYRHMNMVRKMIGTRIGTGGSTGAGYLEGAMQKHYIFRELSQLNSFLVDRKKIPALSPDITSQLGYHF